MNEEDFWRVIDILQTFLLGRNEMLGVLLGTILINGFLFYLLTCYHTRDKKRRVFTERQLQYHRWREESRRNLQFMAYDGSHQISTMKDVLKEYEKYFDTGFIGMDMTLTEKISRAKQCGIKVNLLYEPECLREYESIYLCQLMGNAFDNAMRTVNGMESGEKWIDIKIRLNKEKKVFIIMNHPYFGELKKGNGRCFTIRKDKKYQGLDLMGMEELIKRMNGEMSILYEDNVFSLMIIIERM